MSTVYTDPRDGSTLRVSSLPTQSSSEGPLLRFLGMEDSIGATIDLNRESVQGLVKQAQEWLLENEVKLPTTPGSVVEAQGSRARAFLQGDNTWRGVSGLLIDPALWRGGWVLISDADQDAS